MHSVSRTFEFSGWGKKDEWTRVKPSVFLGSSTNNIKKRVENRRCWTLLQVAAVGMLWDPALMMSTSMWYVFFSMIFHVSFLVWDVNGTWICWSLDMICLSLYYDSGWLRVIASRIGGHGRIGKIGSRPKGRGWKPIDLMDLIDQLSWPVFAGKARTKRRKRETSAKNGNPKRRMMPVEAPEVVAKAG